MATHYLNAAELEQLTGVPASTFRYWALSGSPEGPPSVKLGRRRVWSRAKVEAWLAERETAAGQ